MSSGISPNKVLQLYRNLLRYGNELKLTDQKYFTDRVKKEFRSNKNKREKEEIEFLFKKGLSLLEKRRVL